jgi:hypothetical protein
MPDPELEEHYHTVVRSICDGRVIPFLGAGANLCGRPAGTSWQMGQYLPKGDELAVYLAEKLGCSAAEKQVNCPKCNSELCIPESLSRVSQHISVMSGDGPLYEKLHELLAARYPPTSLHQFLAGLPKFFRKNNYSARYQLIVTTNYDDILECAFQNHDEPYDLVTYISEKDQRGRFLHQSSDGNERLIEKPNEYVNVSTENATVILKIHGAVNRNHPERDSFVITEDDYIDCLTRTDISKLIPVKLSAKMKMSNFLFLGYSLGDWNMRAILHRIWGEQKRNYQSWAVQLNPLSIDKKSWSRRGVDILNVSLEEYVATLADRLQSFKADGGQS